MNSCNDCIHSAVVASGDDNIPRIECRRYPPQLIVFQGEIFQSFPNADTPCGEWHG